MSKTTFTPSQEEAIDKLEYWVRHGTTMEFCLSGRAGTGKTFLTNHIIHTILKNKKKTVSAYTHKAVRVISNFSNTPGHTIHSLHGLRINYDLDSLTDLSKIKFEATGNPKFHKYDYIIMDEASMISDNILELNRRRALEYNTRIIYVGDSLQLPPVSKIFNSTEISKVFSIPDAYELTDIVRQDNVSPLLPVLELVRNDIGSDGNTFLHKIGKQKDDLSNGYGYYSTTFNEFRSIVANMFTSDKFKADINFARIAAYTNDKIDAWNNYIRKGLFDTPNIIAKDDKIMGYQTIVDEYNQILIVNSNDYIVTSVIDRITDDGFKEYVAHVSELGTDRHTIIRVVDHLDPTFDNFLTKIRSVFKNALYADRRERGAKWKEYFIWKAQHMLMTPLTLFPDSKNKGHIKKDIGYAYAVTTHKLQGSTIENILVDLEDIVYDKWGRFRKNYDKAPNIINTRNRLIYTALSRAEKKAIILTKH